MKRAIRTLLFSTLYPSAARPAHGIFVETRLRELLKLGQVETRVVAPVPWFPSRHKRWGEFASMAATPERELRDGVEVLHPRYYLLPKVGMTLAPLALALGSRATVARLLGEGFDFDLIDAHYYYPDGVAAALLASWFGKPLTITARGTDLNLIPRHFLPRRMIQWAARRADASIGVCQALVDVLQQMKADPARLHVMRNGVDLQRFFPLPQAQAKEALGVRGAPMIVSVGLLIERKGHHLAIEALARLRARWPEAALYIVGEGPERSSLQAQIDSLGLESSVRLVGSVPQSELPRWYSAADALVLASSREGWANVLLEAMACGTPCVATKVWGTPEVVAPDVGVLVAERTGVAVAQGVERLLALAPRREAVRRYAEGFSWEQTSLQQLSLFSKLANGAARA
jgi:glycosyltransferase involved in cell wall biosynthesis